MKTNKIIDILYSLISIIFIVIVGFLFNLSVFNTSAITIDPVTEYTYYLKDNIFKNLLIIAIILLLLFTINKNSKSKKILDNINNNKDLYKKIKRTLIIAIFVLCFIFVISGRFFSEADQYSVQVISGQILKNNFSSLNPGEYLDRCPHQIGLVLISSVFTLIFGADNYIALSIINCIFISLFYKELADILDEFKYSNVLKLCVILSAFVFPVLLFYSYFIYGTIPGLTLSLIAFRYGIKYFNDDNKRYLIYSFLALLFAQFFKTNYIIFAIAMIVYFVLKSLELRKIRKLIFCGLLCLTILFQSFLPKLIMEVISNRKIDQGISSYAYVAMSMQESDRAPGWYNGYVNDSYFEANCTKEAQKEIASKQIEERLEYFINNPKKAEEFYMKKTSSLWNNPTFQCFWNLQRKIPKKEAKDRPSWLLWMVDKEGSYNISRYLDIVMTIIYFGALLYGISLLNKKNHNSLVLFSIFFIGGFIFHMFWEGKAQYTFVYFILLIPLAILGYHSLITGNHKIKIKPVNVCLGIVLILLTTLFAINKFNYLNKDNTNYYSYIYYTVDDNKYGGD